MDSHGFAETRKYTHQELVNMSIEYSKKGRLAPITTVVAPVCSPDEPMKDPNWLDRGMFTPVICKQAGIERP